MREETTRRNSAFPSIWSAASSRPAPRFKDTITEAPIPIPVPRAMMSATSGQAILIAASPMSPMALPTKMPSIME